MANEQSQNGRGEYQIDEITYAKGGFQLMVENSNLGFDKLCYCTCLREMFKFNYLRGKYIKRSAAPLMLSIVFCILL